MNLASYRSQLQKLIQQRNGYLSLAAVLALICLIELLLICALAGSQRIILVPPELNGPAWMTGRHADSAYFASMSRYFVGLMLNVTPVNAQSQYQEALKMVKPHYYGLLQEQLVEEADRLNKEHITTTFDINQIAVDANNNQANVTGNLNTYIGNARTSQRETTYQLTFQLQNSRWWVTSFEEKKS